MWRDASARVDSAFHKLVPYARRIGQQGWTVPMWAPWPDLAALALVDDAAVIDAIMVRAYTEERGYRFRNMIAHIIDRRGLHRWHPIIRQAEQAYRRKLYLTVVPTLLTVVDGSLAGVTGKLASKTDPKKLTSKGRRQEASGRRAAVWASLEGFVGAVFGPWRFSDPEPQRINRHWILKGRSSPEWTQADCLRLFQAVEAIATLETDKTYRMRRLIRDPVIADLIFGQDD